MDNYERLLMLFSLHEKAMGHPKYSAMMPKIAGEIDSVVNRIVGQDGAKPAPAPVRVAAPEPQSPVSARAIPAETFEPEPAEPDPAPIGRRI